MGHLMGEDVCLGLCGGVSSGSSEGLSSSESSRACSCLQAPVSGTQPPPCSCPSDADATLVRNEVGPDASGVLLDILAVVGRSGAHEKGGLKIRSPELSPCSAAVPARA